MTTRTNDGKGSHATVNQQQQQDLNSSGAPMGVPLGTGLGTPRNPQTSEWELLPQLAEWGISLLLTGLIIGVYHFAAIGINDMLSDVFNLNAETVDNIQFWGTVICFVLFLSFALGASKVRGCCCRRISSGEYEFENFKLRGPAFRLGALGTVLILATLTAGVLYIAVIGIVLSYFNPNAEALNLIQFWATWFFLMVWLELLPVGRDIVTLFSDD